MDSKESVGFYTNTLILNGVLVTLITTIDMVLLPKFSNLVSKGDIKSVLKIISKSLNIQVFFTLPLMFGIILITPKLVPWYFGNEFLILIKTIPLVSPLVIIMPLGTAIGRQYLVPFNRIKVYNIAVILGAIVSIVANFVFIPVLGLYGALIATLLAELFVTFTRFVSFLKETKIKLPLVSFFCYFFSSLLMYIGVRIITNNLSVSIFTTIIQIILGITIYMVLTSILKNNPLISIVKSSIKRGV